ncbi:MAG TPA: ABC transporter permease [Gemmatimonadaceae bacterium]|nr:ABC transporter permease [Gemmatimonadaceae bacterium]
MKLPSFRRRRERDIALDDEIRSHLTMAAADRVARGESPEAAAAAVRREFGNVTHVKEVTREGWGGAWLDQLEQDARFAARLLRRGPMFAATAMATLALGIGLTTAMFTVVRSVLLRPLPFAAPNELFVISHEPSGVRRFFGLSMADREYAPFSRATTTFRSTTSYRTYPSSLVGGAEPARIPVAAVTPSFFATLGVQPRHGHAFAIDSDGPGSDAVALISATLWREQFAGDTAVIGRSVLVDGYRKTIVGVMPDGFDFPRHSAMWVPLASAFDSANTRFQVVIGRLARGATPERAAAELRAFAAHDEAGASAAEREREVSTIVPLHEALVGDVRKPLVIFSIAVGLVLLIACANVSNLMLLRATARRHELGIRSALGAERGRLLRQLLTESVVIAVAGGVAGLALAEAGVRLLVSVLPLGILPRASEIHIDPVVIGIAAVACIATGLLSGTLPAIGASKRDPRDGLTSAGRVTGRAPLRRFFVAIETSLSLVLLVGAGLMIRSFERLQSVDLGFVPDHLAVATLDFPESQYRSVDELRGVEKQLAGALSAIPGSHGVAAVNWLPLDSTYVMGDFTLADGQALPRGYSVLKPCVSANYFSVMGIRVRDGRGFLDSDSPGAEQVVVISEAMARKFWPKGGAIGQRLTFAEKPGPGDWLRIVGVVDDVVHDGPASALIPALYRPIAQVTKPFWISHLAFVARTEGDPAALVAPMRKTIHALEPTQPIGAITTMESNLSAVTAEPRFRSMVVVLFAAMALTMAGVGIYGILAFAVAEQTREIGIRIALGASRSSIVRLMLAAAAGATIPGAVIGIVGALVGMRALSSFLFGVGAADPFAYAAATLVLLVTAAAATIGPARRASRVDPMLSMRIQ